MKYILTLLLLVSTCKGQNIYLTLKRQGVLNPEIATRIAITETSLKPKYNNYFGFRKRKYLRFTSMLECVKYYKKWETKNYRKHINNNLHNCDYYHFILAIGYVDGVPFSKRGQEYIKKLKKVNCKSCKLKN